MVGIFCRGAVLSILLLFGCGDPPEVPGVEEGPPDAVPGSGERGPVGDQMIRVELVFHRGEEPEAVERTVRPPPEAEGFAPDVPLRLRAALHLLTRGPSPEEETRGLSSFFSPDSSGLIQSARLEGRRVVLDFRDFRSLIPNASSSAGSRAFLDELNGTVFANSDAAEVQEVEYRLDGSCEAFWAFLQRSCTIVERPPAGSSR